MFAVSVKPPADSPGADARALHAADSHDLIRVLGARVNNLKDVTVEIPKRRLTQTRESIPPMRRAFRHC